jgi:hypothetical protein
MPDDSERSRREKMPEVLVIQVSHRKLEKKRRRGTTIVFDRRMIGDKQ